MCCLINKKCVILNRGVTDCCKTLQKGEQTMRFDYSKLLGAIREKFKTQEEFAKAMRMNMSTLSSKLNNRSEFTAEEIVRACRLLNIPNIQIPYYFFMLEN